MTFDKFDKCLLTLAAGLLAWSSLMAREPARILSVSASAGTESAARAFDRNPETAWELSAEAAAAGPWLMCTIGTPGDVCGLELRTSGLSKESLEEALSVYVTYDPMNLGEAVDCRFSGSARSLKVAFEPRYGAHVRLAFRPGALSAPMALQEVNVLLEEKASPARQGRVETQETPPYMNPDLPVEARVESLLAVMTLEEKMELIREGWGIPGIPHLGIPPITKVEAVHGFSYGSGATIFPQALAMGATWDKALVEEVAMAIGDETVAAGTMQAWSPVLDVAQDARWGRCEETFGEDPVLVSQLGGAWIKGYQSKGLFTTPKHFGGHGAPLGGRDSHDIGLSEREMREVHLVPFRHVIRHYDCQSLMMAYSDFLGVPVAKSRYLLQHILREEWGFSGFIVSDCGAIGNLTSRKHYTALDKVEAANQALAAGIATNCGDTYNDPEVIRAACDGRLDREALDNVCRSMLRMMFRNGLFEQPRREPLDWNRIYPGWNSEFHRELARRAARESIVLLENRDSLLPLDRNVATVAVVGPGADDLQPGDYTPKLQPGQLQSVLTGIRQAVGPDTEVLYAKGCEFTGEDGTGIPAAVEAARRADVVVMVLGDCSTSEATLADKTSGENHDYATLILPGRQQQLLEEVAATGTPVVLVLQAGRPYNLTRESALCRAVLVNWLPGQEGGPATADVLFGDCNPAGRLPMTFPRHVGQLPLYYNFKTSGRRYEYADMPYYPLYRFGYGLSYTRFEYADLEVAEREDGHVDVAVTVRNVGPRAGDEVVQLYVTDMYASVKTRVMELKDFSRIHLAPGEARRVGFELTPYELSLLDERMDRVVEPGTFRILVGGSSPRYAAGDRIKESVGYADASEGVSADRDYTHAFAADFLPALSKVEERLSDGGKTVWVSVRNAGNLTDAGILRLYVGGRLKGEEIHYELDPGEERLIPLTIARDDAAQPVVVTTKYRNLIL